MRFFCLRSGSAKRVSNPLLGVNPNLYSPTKKRIAAFVPNSFLLWNAAWDIKRSIDKGSLVFHILVFIVGQSDQTLSEYR